MSAPAQDLRGPRDRRGEHAIIGAGFCGLGVAAAFKRHGIPFRVFERSDAVGGNWYHGVYDSAHIISSRKTTEYRDFPMPASYPDFPSGKPSTPSCFRCADAPFLMR